MNMIYLPPLRRLLVPALCFVILVIFYRLAPFSPTLPSFVIDPTPASQAGTRLPIKKVQTSLTSNNASEDHLFPPVHSFYTYSSSTGPHHPRNSSRMWQPVLQKGLEPLFRCHATPNQYTGHIRLPQVLQNISMVPPGSTKPDSRTFWNPTIISLPYWSPNQYLVVQRILTDGTHQINVMCEANVCYTGSEVNATKGENPCSAEDLKVLGPTGGMRCAHSPITLSVPPTPAARCLGKFATYPDIPGFHDPRIFWSGKGEPLMMVNTQ